MPPGTDERPRVPKSVWPFFKTKFASFSKRSGQLFLCRAGAFLALVFYNFFTASRVSAAIASPRVGVRSLRLAGHTDAKSQAVGILSAPSRTSLLDYMNAAFNSTDVSSVKPGPEGEFFLREA